jgi:hypothetical protein
VKSREHREHFFQDEHIYIVHDTGMGGGLKVDSSQNPKIGEIRFDRFAQLYQKYVAGKKWLDARIAAGQDVSKDTEDYTLNVLLPLHKLWETFTAEERRALNRITEVYDKFDGKNIEFTQEKLAI